MSACRRRESLTKLKMKIQLTAKWRRRKNETLHVVFIVEK
jgi:hypothetical protein